MRRPVDPADDAHAELGDVPVGHGAGIGDVERDVFETQNGQGASRRRWIYYGAAPPQAQPPAVAGAFDVLTLV